MDWEEYQLPRYISDSFGDNFDLSALAERRCELCGKALEARAHQVAVFMWGGVLHLPHSEQMFQHLLATGKIERVEVGADCRRTLLRFSEEEGFFLHTEKSK
jgi:hypothetical protein